MNNNVRRRASTAFAKCEHESVILNGFSKHNAAIAAAASPCSSSSSSTSSSNNITGSPLTSNSSSGTTAATPRSATSSSTIPNGGSRQQLNGTEAVDFCSTTASPNNNENNNNNNSTNGSQNHRHQNGERHQNCNNMAKNSEKDCYATLGVNRNATDQEIKQAFKKQALLHHPDKNDDPESHRAFAKISAAFDVLSNRQKRQHYDRHGMDGMKRSATFNGSSMNGSASASKCHSFSRADVGATYSNVLYKDPPIHQDLFVTLEDVMSGVVRKVKVTRKVLKRDHTVKMEEKILIIEVKPGWKEGTKIIFEREGDKRPGVIPADVIFILRDKPHSIFRRHGSDIVYTAKVMLKTALTGGRLLIPTLGGEKKLLKWTDVVQPKSEKRLKGMGLPIPHSATARGDLVVHFDIVFPGELSNSEKQMLDYILPPFPRVSNDP